MKHVFIVNPISGRNSGKKAAWEITEYCQKNNIDYQIVYSKYPGNAKEIASEYFINDDVCLYAVGGDGTANEVLNGLNDQVQMAIIPAGSGNDFYGNLSKEVINLKEVIADTIDGEVVAVDYGLVNHFRFMNIVSIGFDAEINYQVNYKYRHQKWIPTKLLYYYSAIASVTKPKPFHITYEVDGTKYQQVCLLIAVANGIRYGGGFHPAPMAKINDGILNICVVDFVKSSMILKLLPLYRQGKHEHFDIVKFTAGKDIKLMIEKPANINADGETFQAQELVIRLQVGGLKLRVSKKIKEKLLNGN